MTTTTEKDADGKVTGITQTSEIEQISGSASATVTVEKTADGKITSAEVEVGKGFGATYSMLWPLIRIDYILIPEHYGAVSHSVPKSKCSDHYPVVAEFNVTDE